MNDNFNGDTPHLIRCIDALLKLDADGALVPHGIPGHARTMLEAAAVRLGAEPVAEVVAGTENFGAVQFTGPIPPKGTKLYTLGVTLPSQAALDSPGVDMPPGFTPEEKRAFILGVAAARGADIPAPLICWGLSSFCAEAGHKCRAAGACVYAPPHGTKEVDRG